MRHLIICREYPPAPSGGIGTYAFHLSHLLAEAGETVHVIGQMWGRAPVNAEELCQGRLIIHRVPFEDWTSLLPRQPHPRLGETEKSLFRSDFAPQAFSWQASLLAEQLIEQEAVDIIEAQDYEAPLYYFQLRRAIGKGPKRQPPCLIHLHSPTEFIALHNEWDLALPGLLTARRLEDYSIAAADALLCPSNYLARQTTSHYRLAEDAIKIIPYPIGDTRILERDASTWESGPISYVGRLEKRKGVIEWVEAAVAMARQYRDARFEFVGGDTLDARGASLRESLEGMIPGDLKPVFCFRGEQNRSSLSQFLARARAVVVPSRWENFPNTCIEAMGSGLPVIASREGGMTEMIEDGRTGWLAGGPGSEGLREALSRALETPAAKVAEMGREAASRIRQICDNQRIVEEHIELRRRVVHQGATRSLLLPANLPWARSPLSGETPRRAPKSRGSKGLAVVITCSDSGAAIDGCLQRLTEQTREPASVVIVDNGSSQDRTLKVLGRVRREGWQVIRTEDEGSASARNAGIGAVLGSGSSPLGFVFLDAEDRLKSNFIDVCESTLERCTEVGIVSGWARRSKYDKSVVIRPCPGFPYQWLANEAAPFSAVRTEALLEAGSFRPAMAHGYDDWDLFNAVMAAGWVAVTVPEVLAYHRYRNDTAPHITNLNGNARARRELLERFPDLLARDAKEIVLFVESASARSLAASEFPLRERLARARAILRYPRGPVLRVLRVLKDRIFR